MGMIDQARHRYIPSDGIKMLFVAEAPPQDPKRFFYFDKVDSHDWLFLALMRQLYSDARKVGVCELRSRKADFLRRFQVDGYYLVDLRQDPMPQGASRAEKCRVLTDERSALKQRLKDLVNRDTPIVLIGSAVYAVCFEQLKPEFNIINTEMIDFPSSGRQAEFKRKLGRLLDGWRTIEVKTERRTHFVSITAEVQRVVTESRAQSGVCHLYVTHTTAGITINEGDDPDVARDIEATLDKLAPRDAGYKHYEGNADSHVKSTLVGVSQTVHIENGRLALGRWQAIFLCEFDGPRTREVRVKIVADQA
ncbi:MAG: secondary thiamine-phosphate synthase enzyme YjbQ [Candidatus Acidiferrales bacterium]